MKTVFAFVAAGLLSIGLFVRAAEIPPSPHAKPLPLRERDRVLGPEETRKLVEQKRLPPEAEGQTVIEYDHFSRAGRRYRIVAKKPGMN